VIKVAALSSTRPVVTVIEHGGIGTAQGALAGDAPFARSRTFASIRWAVCRSHSTEAIAPSLGAEAPPSKPLAAGAKRWSFLVRSR